MQKIIVIVERLRLRSPGPDLVYKLIGLIQGSDLTYMLHMIIQTHRTRAGSNRLTVNVIRNQQPFGPEQLEAEGRNRRTLDETNIASVQPMKYDYAQLVDLRRSFARYKNVNYDMLKSTNFRPARPALRDEAGGHFCSLLYLGT